MKLADALDVDAFNDELKNKARAAYHKAQFKEAYAHYTASLLNLALQWFQDEGVGFARPNAEITPTELLVGLAIAAEREVQTRGDEASARLEVASWLLSAVAELRITMERPIGLTVDEVSHYMAEVIALAGQVGQVDGIATVIRLGWLDKLAEHEIARTRRAAGAAATNAKKASVRDRALGAAIAIAARNPTLSHEDLGVRIREQLRLSTTVRTLTEWVRSWRKQGFLTPQKAT